uniref:Uncharacterized protein n=1 Tax=Acaryochloris sp. HICR111A TaxID=576912 RepID=I6U2P9_9CYAN|nr:hypothetical protein [Acaryochloris sp. HICR111A]
MDFPLSSIPAFPMPQTTDPITIDDLKQQIKKLNSKAGQMKMDLHDIAEGLPADLEQLPQAAARTYDLYCQLRDLKQQLKNLEALQ